MKKVLVVAYYTPPLGMSGVMRVTKLVKFLPRFGWQPVVLTVKKIAYYHYDERLLDDWQGIEIHRSASLDPARLRNLILPGRAITRVESDKASWLSNVLCFPDAKVGWYPFAMSLGERIMIGERPDALFATAPPFTALMIGAALKKRFHLPLVSDFRDPWPMGFVTPPKFRLQQTERFRHRVLEQSDAVLAVNQGTAAFLEGRAEVLENGFDPEELQTPARRYDGFNIVHVGNVWENERELLTVLDALQSLKGAKVRLVGKTDDRLRLRLAQHSNFENLGLLPHSETLAVMKGADVLLYLSKPNQAAGIKLYEYLGAGRPIISVCDECTEAARLIEQHRAGIAVGVVPAEIRETIERSMQGKLDFAPTGIERYNRLNQAERLARIFDLVSGST